jgi:hypothetical protein
MFKHFRLLPFFAGVVIGIIAVFFIKPQQDIIRKYPTPETAGKTTYRDKNGVCYKYNAKVVDCDTNEGRLKDFPLEK